PAQPEQFPQGLARDKHRISAGVLQENPALFSVARKMDYIRRFVQNGLHEGIYRDFPLLPKDKSVTLLRELQVHLNLAHFLFQLKRSTRSIRSKKKNDHLRRLRTTVTEPSLSPRQAPADSLHLRESRILSATDSNESAPRVAPEDDPMQSRRSHVDTLCVEANGLEKRSRVGLTPTSRRYPDSNSEKCPDEGRHTIDGIDDRVLRSCQSLHAAIQKLKNARADGEQVPQLMLGLPQSRKKFHFLNVFIHEVKQGNVGTVSSHNLEAQVDAVLDGKIIRKRTGNLQDQRAIPIVDRYGLDLRLKAVLDTG